MLPSNSSSSTYVYPTCTRPCLMAEGRKGGRTKKVENRERSSNYCKFFFPQWNEHGAHKVTYHESSWKLDSFHQNLHNDSGVSASTPETWVLLCERKNCTKDSSPSLSSGEHPSSSPVSLQVSVGSLHILFTEQLRHHLLAMSGGLTFLTGETKAKIKEARITKHF